MTIYFSARGLLLATACRSLLAGFALLAPDQAHAQLLQGALDGNVMDSNNAAIAGARLVNAGGNLDL